jgi:hypothetical protein
MEIKLTVSGGSGNVSKWLKTGLHTALSGVGVTTAAIAIDPATFNLAQAKHLGMACLTGAVVGLLGLLRQNPFSTKFEKTEVPQ